MLTLAGWTGELCLAFAGSHVFRKRLIALTRSRVKSYPLSPKLGVIMFGTTLIAEPTSTWRKCKLPDANYRLV